MYRRMPIAAVGAVIAAALAVTGCGSSKKSTTTSSSSSAAAATTSSSASSSSGSSGSHNKNLVLIQGTKADNFYVTMGCGAQAEAAKLGYSLKVEGPAEFAPSEQIPIVDAVTATKPAAVMIAPTDAEALISPMQSMKSAGIKVIQVDTHVNNNSIASASISSNNVEGGELAAQELAKEIGDKGSVVVMNEEAGVSTTEERIQGFMTGIKKYSGITVLPTQYVGDNPAKADSAITAEYAAHHDLAGVFATNVLVAQGVGTGLKTAGISGKVKMIGYDADPTQIQQLRGGVVNALIAQEPYQEGVDGVEQAVNAISGKPTQSVLTGLKVLTLSNLSANSSYIYKSSC